MHHLDLWYSINRSAEADREVHMAMRHRPIASEASHMHTKGGIHAMVRPLPFNPKKTMASWLSILCEDLSRAGGLLTNDFERHGAVTDK